MSDRLSYVTLRFHKLFRMGVKLGLSGTERNTGCSHRCAWENIRIRKQEKQNDAIYKGKSESIQKMFTTSTPTPPPNWLHCKVHL
jgi:hypothetical protein